jgi:hypothetical protein
MGPINRGHDLTCRHARAYRGVDMTVAASVGNVLAGCGDAMAEAGRRLVPVVQTDVAATGPNSKTSRFAGLNRRHVRRSDFQATRGSNAQ